MIQATHLRGRGGAAVGLVFFLSVCSVAALRDPVVYTEARTSGSTFRDRGISYARRLTSSTPIGRGAVKRLEHPVISDSRLYVRNQDILNVSDITSRSTP
jgi:hypothetical protein